MKIVVIASLAYSLVNFRGALLRALVARGHQVVACAPDEDPDSIAALAAMQVAFRRIDMARAGLNPLDDLRTLIGLCGVMRQESPQLVLAYTQKPIVYGGIATRIAAPRAQFFAMVSGLGHAYSDGGGAPRAILRMLLSRLFRIAFAQARAIFVFNDCDAAELRAHRMVTPSHRIVQVAGSGVDIADFAQADVPQGPPRFLLIARMLRDKGIVEFIEAAKHVRRRHPDARFELLGWLDPNPTGLTADALQQHLHDSGVDYLGGTRDVRPFLADATVFVLPSYYREGLPRTLLEALAIGRAIITTDMPGCRETVIPGFNGFRVPPRDVTALGEAMLRLADDRALAARMGARSRWLARRRFDVHRVNRVLLDVLLDDSAPAPPQQRGIGDRRWLEVGLAGAAGLFLMPVIVSVALIVRVAMGRPILLVQRRGGRDGIPFPLVKFRTMRELRDGDGVLLPDADRVTPVGKILRRTRLDELPELLNVLAGEMALVGPRPLLPETLAALGDDGLRRAAVRPGLTGWAQVNGNTLLSASEKLALDLWYVAHRSLRLDALILWRTLSVMIRGERRDSAHIGRAYAGIVDRRG